MKTRLILLCAAALLTVNPGGLCAFNKMKKARTELTEKQMVQRSNDFGFTVFRATAGDGNALESPLSLSLALSMTAGGAAAKTEQCMVSTLGFENYSAEEIGSFYKNVLERLSQADTSTRLEIADAIWADKKIPVKEDFTGYAADKFNADVRNADFGSHAAVDEINRWCAAHTNGKIGSILDKLTPDMAMVLLNAVYFYGNWVHDFNNTRPQQFTDIDGHRRNIDMMHTKGRLNYAETGKFRIVELPYGNGNYVMDVLLPQNESGFKEAAAELDSDQWEELCGKLGPASVNLALPKFKLEYEIRYDDTLQKLGMAPAFNKDADFSRMSDFPLAIGLVKQKTFINVTEKGTEAAAVTAVGMLLTSAGPDQSISFIADRPFIFAIRERTTGAILFLGQKTR